MDQNMPLTRESMRADIARALRMDPQEIAGGDDLADLGLDSLRAMDLLTRWNRGGPAMDFMLLAESPTLDAWWNAVQAHAGQAQGGQAQGGQARSGRASDA